MPSNLRVVGYAIVSADGMIADAAGRMPPSIINDADQKFFAEQLDRVDVVVHGRDSQEHQNNSPRRKRLVLTRQVPRLAPHSDNPNAMLWNPGGLSLKDACAGLGIDRGTVAVIGGTDVFGLFLPRYDQFELTVAAHAQIPGGRPLFPGIPPATPAALLQQHGLHIVAERVLDTPAGVSVQTWQRLQPSHPR